MAGFSYDVWNRVYNSVYLRAVSACVAMSQTRLASFVGAWGNLLLGYLVAVAANAVVLPAFGYQLSIADSFMIAVVFTLISLARPYVLRRVFNGIKWGNR